MHITRPDFVERVASMRKLLVWGGLSSLPRVEGQASIGS